MTDDTDSASPRAPLGGNLAWWPFAVALGAVAVIVAAIVLVNVLAGGGTTGSRQQGTGLTSNGATACPEYFEHVLPKGTSVFPWVPAKPAGVHSKQKLVPTLHPTHVTICRYRGHEQSSTASQPLSGQRQLTGNIDTVITTLRALPKAKNSSPSCTSDLPVGVADNYLIGLRFAEAIVWVSAPTDPCFGAGNGAFHTDSSVSGYASASFAAGTWVGSPK